MRVRKAIGASITVLVLAAGAAWAPAASAQVAFFGGPRLGVEIRDVETADVSKLKLAGQAGVIIEGVTKDSAAARAGLKIGDCIVQFDGEAVRSAQQFTRLVSETSPGKTVKVGVMRDGKRLDVEGTLSKAEAGALSSLTVRENALRDVEREIARVAPQVREFRLQRPPAMSGDNAFRLNVEPLLMTLGSRGRLGVTLQELTPELATYFNVKDGVLVSAVRADSPAAKAGIKAGDVITGVNDKAIGSVDELTAQLRGKDGEVSLGVTRDKKAMTLKATLEKTDTIRVRRTIKGIGV